MLRNKVPRIDLSSLAICKFEEEMYLSFCLFSFAIHGVKYTMFLSEKTETNTYEIGGFYHQKEHCLFFTKDRQSDKQCPTLFEHKELIFHQAFRAYARLLHFILILQKKKQLERLYFPFFVFLLVY